jgi:hypothetical protein
MDRDYKDGKESDVSFFFGREVEHTPAFGMHTLFVVGVKNPDETIHVISFLVPIKVSDLGTMITQNGNCGKT